MVVRGCPCESRTLSGILRNRPSPSRGLGDSLAKSQELAFQTGGCSGEGEIRSWRADRSRWRQCCPLEPGILRTRPCRACWTSVMDCHCRLHKDFGRDLVRPRTGPHAAALALSDQSPTAVPTSDCSLGQPKEQGRLGHTPAGVLSDRRSLSIGLAGRCSA